MKLKQRTRRVNTLLLTLTLALVAAACGSDGGSDSEDPSDSPAATSSSDAGNGENESSDNDSASGSGLPPGGSGTVTIGGEVIDPAWVGSCLIDEMFNPQPDDLDINVSLDGGLEALFLEISMIELIGLGPNANAYTYTQVRPELQLRSESGSFANYEAGPFVTGPDGSWYLDEIGGVPMAIALDTEHDGVLLDQPPVVIQGNNVSGSFTVEGEGGPVEVTFDLTLVDAVDCSL